MAGLYTAGLTAATFPLTGNEQAAFDTTLSSGQNPDQEAITTSQLAGFQRAVSALTDAATIATDASLSGVYSVTLGGNRTLANPSNLTSGVKFDYEIVQDATGARTLTYGTVFKFAGGTNTLTTTASAIDKISCVYDGTIILATLSTNYK